MKRRIGFLLSFLAGSVATAYGTSCGTVASPVACSVTVGAGTSTTFTAANFAFLNNAQSGGGALYRAGDINIDIASGGGRTGLVTFSKNSAGPTPGVVFLANPGDASAFTFRYDLTIAPNGPGTVDYSAVTASLTQSNLGNGLSSAQAIISPVNCNVSTAVLNKTCALSGQLNTITVGNIVTVTGNTGNTSILSFSNLLDTTFTAGREAQTPEPATFALVGLGLAGLGYFRKRQRT